MADIVTSYALATDAGTITFNSGSLGDGGIVFTFWKGPRRVVFDGLLWLDPISNSDCQERRNDLAFALQAALASIIATDGTLTWTPAGQAAQSLTVRNEVPLAITYTDNYLTSAFSFGLVSAAADPS